MEWVVMQPTDDNKYAKATQSLHKTDKCVFKLSINGAHLKPVVFVTSKCNDNKRNFHFFTGEGACVSWSIRKNR